MAIAIFLIGVLGATPAATRSSVELLSKAEAAFVEGVRLRDAPEKSRPLFREAAQRYEELNQLGIHSAAIWHNQGNAFLLAGDLPRAILAYRRGLRLDPADQELQHNLLHAREQVNYTSEALGKPTADAPSWWQTRWLVRVRLGLALLCNTLLCVAITRRLMTRQTASRNLALVCLLGVLLLLPGLVLDAWRAVKAADQPFVVIAADGVLLRTGNGSSYPRRSDAPLNRGVEAQLLYTRGEWLQVELSGGAVGWLPRAYALVEQPQPRRFCDAFAFALAHALQ